MDKIYFSPIDCKDNYFLLGTDNDGMDSLENMTTLAIARRLYFNRMKELQAEIKRIFEPRLKEVNNDNRLSKDDWMEWRDKLDEIHGIDRNTNIFYT